MSILDIESRTDENSDLRAKVLSLKEQLSSQNEQMVSLINTNEIFKDKNTYHLSRKTSCSTAQN